jgi:hypothetical protein
LLLVQVITMLTTKPMQLAQYFCTGAVEGMANWRHYALAVDMYTHFTSPIRCEPGCKKRNLCFTTGFGMGGECEGSGACESEYK